VVEAIGNRQHQILVFEATPVNLSRLAAVPEKVKAFTDRGGWLMAWGLTPEGLAHFNKIVGVGHLLRPFERERVTLPAVRDPLLAGLTGRDVALESSEQIFPWAGDKYMVDDEFGFVVDLEDIAPFCEFPGARAGDHKAAREAAAGWSRNLVNGFTSADAWKLIYYMNTASAKITLKLPREEEITDLSIVLNTHYAKATRVHLFYNQDPTPVTLTTKPNNERQDFSLVPRKVRSLTIELAQFEKPDKTTGIDNLWIKVNRSPEWHRKVKPLLNVGALVKYPMGSGGLILNQVLVKPREAVPVNAQKKRAMVRALLNNLHASFSRGRILTLGDLQFQPLPLHEQCNQYLTTERGWLEGSRDLAHVPVGRVQLAGVPYEVRDFRTSPVPACVMLAGPGSRGRLPTQVNGLKVNRQADVLFFLHTFHRVRDWQPPHQGDRTPPAVFLYRVHYADGKTVDIPVHYGEGVDHWINKEPVGLKDAAVAWAAPFVKDTSGDQAVLYQMPWTNPRPEVPLSQIDMSYAPQSGSQYGTPVLLGITTGSRLEK
jgi:beta-galactosidase